MPAITRGGRRKAAKTVDDATTPQLYNSSLLVSTLEHLDLASLAPPAGQHLNIPNNTFTGLSTEHPHPLSSTAVASTNGSATPSWRTVSSAATESSVDAPVDAPTEDEEDAEYVDDRKASAATARPVVRPKVSHSRKTEEGHIKRPRNAFIIFRSHFCANPHQYGIEELKDHREISRLAAGKWRLLSRHEHRKFEILAEEEKMEHRRRYPDYKYKPVYKHQSSTRPRRKQARKAVQTKLPPYEISQEISIPPQSDQALDEPFVPRPTRDILSTHRSRTFTRSQRGLRSVVDTDYRFPARTETVDSHYYHPDAPQGPSGWYSEPPTDVSSLLHFTAHTFSNGTIPPEATTEPLSFTFQHSGPNWDDFHTTGHPSTFDEPHSSVPLRVPMSPLFEFPPPYPYPPSHHPIGLKPRPSIAHGDGGQLTLAQGAEGIWTGRRQSVEDWNRQVQLYHSTRDAVSRPLRQRQDSFLRQNSQMDDYLNYDELDMSPPQSFVPASRYTLPNPTPSVYLDRPQAQATIMTNEMNEI